MNQIYYYEIQEKTKQTEQSAGNEKSEVESKEVLHNENQTAATTSIITTKNATENLLNDYEIIDNDEFENAIDRFEDEDEEEEIVDLTRRNRLRNSFENPLMSTRFTQPATDNEREPRKLQLNLNATKISLKTQTKCNNQPIMPDIEKLTIAKQTQKHLPNTPPISFIIQPIKNKPTHSLGANNESNTLPEIVLTSFEMRENAMTTTKTMSTTRHTMKKSATVTFQTVTSSASTTPTAAASALSPCSPTIKTQVNDEFGLFAKNLMPSLPPPPPPPPLPSTTKTAYAITRQQQSHQHRGTNFNFNNSYNNNNNNQSSISKNKPTSTTTTTAAEVYDKFRRDSEDSSEINSQLGGGGNSTSPESIMDNVLSAASSVSVCESSTNSSAATEVRSGAELDFRGLQNRGSSVAEKLTNTRLIEGKSTVAYSSLNSKSKTSKEYQQTATLQQALSPSLAKTMAPPLLPPPPPPPSTIAVQATPSNATTPVLTWLQPPHDQFEVASIIRSRSPSPTPSIRIMPERALYPDELKCQICAEPYRDPRTLNCLHSFCFQCLVNENFKQDQSIPFWSQPTVGSNTSPIITNTDNEWKCK